MSTLSLHGLQAKQPVNFVKSTGPISLPACILESWALLLRFHCPQHLSYFVAKRDGSDFELKKTEAPVDSALIQAESHLPSPPSPTNIQAATGGLVVGWVWGPGKKFLDPLAAQVYYGEHDDDYPFENSYLEVLWEWLKWRRLVGLGVKVLVFQTIKIPPKSYLTELYEDAVEAVEFIKVVELTGEFATNAFDINPNA
ncbi:hypothetical protein BDN72DRAFT_906285 [Pluteus cervinus]|uniref:Uncharacterized protein n=1 Tax=Pluteus cervinus TaxID=181527 RepID=A0ACD2ZZE5_9AGAR|nr:hypothetical protein BDN72DRAFT_906285 [Pluteus cervinus]